MRYTIGYFVYMANFLSIFPVLVLACGYHYGFFALLALLIANIITIPYLTFVKEEK
jgi:hypothetical protein